MKFTKKKINEKIEHESSLLKMIDKLTIGKNSSGDSIPEYTFVKPLIDEFHVNEYELADFAKKHGYKVFRTIGTEELDSGTIIANKECDKATMEKELTNQFGTTVDLREIKIDDEQVEVESLKEDTVKVKDHKWVNKGKEGTHGSFKTKKQADAQRKAMFANGYHEDVNTPNKDVIDTTTTGMSYYNQCIPGNKEYDYMKDRKDKEGHIVNLSPNEYFELCSNMFNCSVEKLKDERKTSKYNDENGNLVNEIEYLKGVIENGKKFPMCMICICDNDEAQEGLHRMYALGEVFGWNEKFPTLLITEPNSDIMKKYETSNDLVEDVNVEKHDTLNDKIWNEDRTLKEDVKEAINKIVDEFLSQLDEMDVVLIPKDVVILGSNCSYNYTNNSDLDVHIIADDSIDCEQKHLDKLYGAYRSLFNKSMDISIKGIPIELYVELGECKAKSNGIYSITNNKWLKEPNKEDIPNIDEDALNKMVNEWESRYLDVIKSNNSEDIDKFIDDIYALRKQGMENGGDFSLENLTFKELRNNGYLDSLKDINNELKGKELSLESIDEELDINKYSTKEILKKIRSQVSKDSTYSIDKDDNIVEEEIHHGYQTSFFRDEITDDEIKLVSKKFESVFGEPFLGLFESKPEISFTINDKNVALNVAKIFNQESVWDNAHGHDIKNKFYDEEHKVNYEEAIKEFDNYIDKLNK